MCLLARRLESFGGGDGRGASSGPSSGSGSGWRSLHYIALQCRALRGIPPWNRSSELYVGYFSSERELPGALPAPMGPSRPLWALPGPWRAPRAPGIAGIASIALSGLDSCVVSFYTFSSDRTPHWNLVRLQGKGSGCFCQASLLSLDHFQWFY
jgi:hypothetical protein